MRCSLLITSFVIAGAALGQPSSDKEYAADEAILRDQRLPTKGAELLQVFRDRTPRPETIEQFKKHVAHMHASPFVERVKAATDLKKMGPVVRPLLESLLAEGKEDAETAGRLREVLSNFPADKDYAAVAAAARLVQRDKPTGAVSVLMEFIQYATNEQVRQEVQRALNICAKTEKASLPILEAASKDAHPARRGAAGEAILRSVGIGMKEKIADLVKDKHPVVRLQIAATLVELHDKSGLPMLIDTIADVPPERADLALELLFRAAGEKAPAVSYGGKSKVKAFCAAWHKWYADNNATLDLAKQLAHAELGFTVIATGLKANKIYEVGPRGSTVHWEFAGPRYPVDVQILGPNRLLMAEYIDRRVTERDFKGNILWQFSTTTPIAAQRLPGGNTFIATTSQLMIVDRDGTQVFSHTPQPATVRAAQIQRNGEIAYLSGSRCVLIDQKGRELKAFNTGGAATIIGANIEVLPNGRILVPLYSQHTVAEFDWNGTKHWSANVQLPVSVSRTLSGNTLVTTTTRVIELDRDGKEVWSMQTDGRPFRARRR